jgi:hypothetical protein
MPGNYPDQDFYSSKIKNYFAANRGLLRSHYQLFSSPVSAGPDDRVSWLAAVLQKLVDSLLIFSPDWKNDG